MIKIQGKIPRDVYLACSGGVDSMAILDFLRRSHNVTVLHFNHGTEHGHDAEQFVRSYCNKYEIDYIVESIQGECPKGESLECWWRDQRYRFIDKYSCVDKPAITCHHLDDCVETWIWSSMNGTGKIIPYIRNTVIRPFRLNRKDYFINWANRHGVEWVEDSSNHEVHATRNYIRHEMMPHVLRINPGIHKTISKKVAEDF